MADVRVLWTEAARLDLAGIVGFIAEESGSARALDALNRLESRCRKLTESPGRGRIVPELRLVDVHTYRELLEGPWRIVYRYDVDRVYVTAVLDGRRDLASLLLERLVRTEVPGSS